METRTRKRIDDPFVPQKRAPMDADRISKICELHKIGIPLDCICDYLGFHTQQMHVWITRGERYFLATVADELNDTQTAKPEDAIFGELYTQLRRANAEFRMTLIKKLDGKNTWVRAMSVLERYDRKSFSRNDLIGGAAEVANPDEKFL